MDVAYFPQEDLLPKYTLTYLIFIDLFIKESHSKRPTPRGIREIVARASTEQ